MVIAKKKKIINIGKSLKYTDFFAFVIKVNIMINGSIHNVLLILRVALISPALSLNSNPEPTTDAVSCIAKAENKPN